MQNVGACRAELHADGVVHAVDLVNRDLSVLVGKAVVSFGVPPGCAVVLRGERVKLRLLQPGDAVRVSYEEVRGTREARAVEVRTGHRVSRPAPSPAPG